MDRAVIGGLFFSVDLIWSFSEMNELEAAAPPSDEALRMEIGSYLRDRELIRENVKVRGKENVTKFLILNPVARGHTTPRAEPKEERQVGEPPSQCYSSQFSSQHPLDTDSSPKEALQGEPTPS